MMLVLTVLSAVKLINFKDSSTNFLYIDMQISACDLEIPLYLSCVRLAYVALCKLPM